MKVSPYSFYIENIMSEPKKAVIFNSNENALTINHGSDIGVNITSLDKSITYLHLLFQSAQQPFETKMFRFIMDDWKDMPRELIYSYKNDIDDDYKHENISLISDKWGERVNQVEILKYIDGINYITIEVAPRSKMHVIIFT